MLVSMILLQIRPDSASRTCRSMNMINSLIIFQDWIARWTLKIASLKALRTLISRGQRTDYPMSHRNNESEIHNQFTAQRCRWHYWNGCPEMTSSIPTVMAKPIVCLIIIGFIHRVSIVLIITWHHVINAIFFLQSHIKYEAGPFVR